MALKFHPDKNPAPHADEAFKAIGTAFAILSDKEKRSHYDTFGEDEGAATVGNPFGGRSPYGADISPEDIFNMFFGVNAGHMPGNTCYIMRVVILLCANPATTPPTPLNKLY